MRESSLTDAVSTWCVPAFSSAVRASGISEVVKSTASVAAVRAIYVRRRRRLAPDSPLIVQTDGILEALDKLEGDTFEMILFVTHDGAKGIVMTTASGIPIFAFPLRTAKNSDE
jgi:hypothetical protein